MKKYFFLFVCMFLPLFGGNDPISVIPKPAEMIRLDGSFGLTASTIIFYTSDECRTEAAVLASRLSRITGYAITAKKGTDGPVVLRLNQKQDKKLGNEGYSLVVDAQTIAITANRPAGLFYAVQTLLQLLPPANGDMNAEKRHWMVPGVQITDHPRFPWRGIMLDVSRHFFSTNDVKKYIDQLAQYKYNTFHWHLTDDHGWRIEIKSLPKLTQVGAWRAEAYGLFSRRPEPKPGTPATYGGYYTHDDIKEIVAYAQERHITVIPEIDIPGHSMAAIASYPELSCTKDTAIRVNPGTRFAEWYPNSTFKMFIDNTLNPSDEKVYEFVDKVMTEVASLFPAPYIHVGGDECYKGYWQQDPGCQALMKKLNIRHIEDLQGYFMGRVEKILKAKGKKLLGWDEILEGGISPEATVMSWRGMKGGIEAATNGHDVVMTPTTYTYIDYNQGDQVVDPPVYAGLRVSKCYEFDPVPGGVDPKRILGGQGNLWSENVPHLRAAEYLSYPRAWALAEVFWSPKESKDWNDFAVRMEHHFTRADAADVNYSRAVYDAVVKTSRTNGGLTLTMGTEIDGIDIHYTIDDTMPDDRSPRYSKPVSLPDGPITLRVQSYRDGTPIGRLITLSREELERRIGK